MIGEMMSEYSEIIAASIGIILAMLTIIQLTQQRKLKGAEAMLERVKGENETDRKRLENQLADSNNNAKVQERLIDVIGKLSGSLDGLRDGYYINTKETKEALNNLDITVSSNRSTLGEAVGIIKQIDKRAETTSESTRTQIDKIALDIRQEFLSLGTKLDDLNKSISSNQNNEREQLRDISRDLRDVIDRAIPILKSVSDDCKDKDEIEAEKKTIQLPKTITDEEKKKEA